MDSRIVLIISMTSSVESLSASARATSCCLEREARVPGHEVLKRLELDGRGYDRERGISGVPIDLSRVECRDQVRAGKDGFCSD